MTLEDLDNRLAAEPEVVKKINAKLNRWKDEGIAPKLIAKVPKEKLPLSDKLKAYLKKNSYIWSRETTREGMYPGLCTKEIDGGVPAVLVDKEVLEAILSLEVKAKQYVTGKGETHLIK